MKSRLTKKEILIGHIIGWVLGSIFIIWMWSWPAPVCAMEVQFPDESFPIEEFVCVKTKYQTQPGLYGIMTSDTYGRDYFLEGRRWVDLGSCYNEGHGVNLYRTEAEVEIASNNQTYLDEGITAEETAEDIAIALLEQLGYNITK